ncbi:MAG: hypothetical protein ACI865_003364 [Flavobacteriaceae bacterium]|jgi:hypothetical protein
MKKSIFIAIASVLLVINANAQSKKMVVANPSVSGLYATTEIASKILRFETIKLETYTVYDQFDTQDAYNQDSTLDENCYGLRCLVKLGQALNVDYVLSGSFDKLGTKIVITLKIIDIKNESLYKSKVREFNDQEAELQRMIAITLKDMHGMTMDTELESRLKFNEQIIISNDVGKVNNSGPRVGYAVLTGSVGEFAVRAESRGGLDIFPGMSMIGYQFEGQYVGTENFSALVEVFANIWGMEQGKFIPSLNLMNGLRFGDAGWEIAFGPGIGLSKTTYGFFDDKGLFGESGQYFSDKDWRTYADATFQEDVSHQNEQGYYQRPSPTDIESSYSLENRHADTRGSLSLTTHFVVGAGRTFKAGALNIPVNLFYTFKKKGGFAGISVGINIVKSKSKIKSRSDI